MRVLQLASHLNVGGITSYVVSLAESLTRRGHQVVLASGGGVLQARVENLRIPHWRLSLHTSAEVSPQVVWAAVQLARRLAAHPVDLIHAHTRVAQVAAHWLWRSRKIPYVTTWHGFYRRRLSRRWWPCTGLITMAISEPVLQHLHDEFKIPRERIRLIPHGIDVARFAAPADAGELQALRAGLRLASDGPVVGTVARLVSAKGVAQLLEGFAQVTARLPKAQLLVVGDGVQRGQLERLAGRLGVGEAVRFAGALPETRAALSLMDAFVFLPATREGFGLALLEAMASGRPIVAIRRGGGAAWVLDETQAALAVAPDDPTGLAQALLRVLTDAAYARQLGSQAFAIAQARYDLDRMVSQVEQVYQEVKNVTSNQ